MSVHHLIWCPYQPEEGIRSSGDGFTGNCEPPDVGAGNQTQALYESSKHSFLAAEQFLHPHRYSQDDCELILLPLLFSMSYPCSRPQLAMIVCVVCACTLCVPWYLYRDQRLIFRCLFSPMWFPGIKLWWSSGSVTTCLYLQINPAGPNLLIMPLLNQALIFLFLPLPHRLDSYSQYCKNLVGEIYILKIYFKNPC